jgi:23S rRNA maturation-related 3'-5' exoribonuclease YhaM
LKEIIKALLLGTKRAGIEKLLDYMEKSGFFEAPASTKYHGASAGKLAEHSFNVYVCAMEIAKALGAINVSKDSIVICAILHDLGKAGQFGKPLYIEATEKEQPYEYNKNLLSLDHEVASVVEIQKYIELTEDEQQAIAWHNGLYGLFANRIKGNETPLYMIIHFADMWASRVIESEG